MKFKDERFEQSEKKKKKKDLAIFFMSFFSFFHNKQKKEKEEKEVFYSQKTKNFFYLSCLDNPNQPLAFCLA